MTALVLATLFAAADPAKPVITVLYFDYQGTDAELTPFRKGFADMVITDLVSWDGVAVVEREKMDAVVGELKLQQSKFFDKTTAVKIGKFVGAQYAITGTMSVAGGELRVDSRVIKAETGQDVVTASVRGPKDKVFELEQELVDKLTDGIDVKLKNNTNAAGRRKVKVPDYATVLAYGQALDLADQGKKEEAQKAFQQVVSRAPSFLLGREKREAYAKRLVEYEQRKQDITADSAAEMMKRSEAALAGDFGKLDQAGQLRHLTMRRLKSYFIARALKAHLSTHDTRPLVVLKGHEAPALAMMRGWLANHRQLEDDLETYLKTNTKVQYGYPQPPPMSGGLADDEVRKVAEAKLGKTELNETRLRYEIFRFVLHGEVEEGEKDFVVAPALGDLDPAEQKRTFATMDAGLKDALDRAAKGPAAGRASAEYEARNILEEKARALERLERDEDAIATFQQILDTFPTDSRNSYIETRIKELLGASHSNTQDHRERWAKALKGCEDMDMRVGIDTVSSRVYRMGLAGLAAQAAELEKACKPGPKTRSGLAYVYEVLAGDAARYDDCDAAKGYWLKYIENNGSIGDMRGWMKNTPWCQIGELEKKVQWMYSNLDENWTHEFTSSLWAIPSNDGKVLSLHGAKEGRLGDDLSLRLEPKGGAWSCTEARWKRSDEREPLVGTCEVKLTKLGEGKGDYYEGTYAATFFVQEDWGKRKMTLTNGTFRLRREMN